MSSNLHAKIRRGIALLSLVVGAVGLAEEEMPSRVFPAIGYFSSPSPIVFPASPVAALVNPAALPYFGKARTLEVANAMAVTSKGYGVYGGAASTGRHSGIGAGFLGDVSSLLIHGFYAGAGYNLGPFAIGAEVVKDPVAGAPIDFALGIARDLRHLFRLTAVVSQLTTRPQTTLGVGVQGSLLSFETDVRLPPFTDLGGGYEVSASTTAALGPLGLYGAIGYQTSGHLLLYTAGGSLKINPLASLLLQYSNTRRLIGGVHLLF